jgi:hypothetical protein
LRIAWLEICRSHNIGGVLRLIRALFEIGGVARGQCEQSGSGKNNPAHDADQSTNVRHPQSPSMARHMH